MSMDALYGLMEALREATNLEDAAGTVLERLLSVTDARLKGGTRTFSGRVLRAVVHLRPDNGYQGLIARGTSTRRAPSAPELLSSATAWQWVRREGRPVAIDVTLQQLHPLKGTTTTPQRLPGWVGKTRQQLSARQVTHLLCLPLRSGRGELPGMISVELSSPMDTGKRLEMWDAHGAELQLMADIATPFLVSLPAKEQGETLTDPLLPVVGRRMAPVVRMLEAFSRSGGTLLLRGATGTGKSHLAKWCHARSPRSSGPFVVATLNTLPEATREGELFGWARGAFTGAVGRHRGLVERAEGGTLFIDEIDKADLSAQGKLLRLLEERRYQVLGDERDRLANVRFIIGSNADLEEEVRQGRFLEDLYFRINVLPVRLPPLSQRQDEIGRWAQFMAERLNEEQGAGGSITVTDEAAALLTSHPWPGNLRQLSSVVFRASAMAGLGIPGSSIEITREHIELALGLDSPRGQRSLVSALQQTAEAFVDEALSQKEQAAPLDLEHTQALRGAVLSAATHRLGSLREAFSLFGLESRFRGGNHLKTFRREWTRLEELHGAIGTAPPPEVQPDLLR